MSDINQLSKRKRIEALVKRSIENAEFADCYRCSSGLQIMDLVEGFSETWPATYFGTADDRKIAGLVLGHMTETGEIEFDEMNIHGYRLLELTADAQAAEFRETAPDTYARLRGRQPLEARSIPDPDAQA